MPMVTIKLPAFLPDSRGNQLAAWKETRLRETGQGRVYLRGPDEVALQLSWLLGLLDQDPEDLPLRQEDEANWSHRIGFEGELGDETKTTLTVRWDLE